MYGRLLAGIAGSNPAGAVDVSVLWVLCVIRERSLLRADHSSRGVTPNVVCLRVVEEPHRKGLDPLGLSNHGKNRAVLDI